MKIHDSGSEKSREAYFEEIYKQYFQRLFAYALVITRSESSAQDVVSEVFFYLWNTKTDLFAVRELKSYLFTCVKNQAIRTMSSDPVHFEIDRYDQSVASIDQVDPEELMVGKELDEFIQSTVDQLPPQCALVFRMVKERNFKYQEVADELGISNETVKYHVKTGLKKLRAELEGHLSESKWIKWVSGGGVALIAAELVGLL